MSNNAGTNDALAEARAARREVGRPAVRLDRALVGCLFAFALCAPHSIAATQGAWLLGLVLWAARLLLIGPRPVWRRTPLDLALCAFFTLTLVSTLFSYEPEISWGKMRAASLFTIVYLVAENVRAPKIVRALVFTLVASCSVNVVYTAVERARGRGVQLTGLAPGSPLRARLVRSNEIEVGDTLVAVDGRAVNDPAELARALAGAAGRAASAADADAATTRVRVYRREFFHEAQLRPGALAVGETPEARLGITGWKRGRDERAAGFYGHYTTYAEMLQLVGSLAVGLLVALRRLRSGAGVALALAACGIGFALLLTLTRASWLAFLASCFVILLAGAASRRVLLFAALAALLVVPAGLYVLRQKRQVGFFDRGDGSVAWRETVYRDGLRVLASRPRHLAVGVGMDSIKRRWREWEMFDGGRLPVGHLHSTPLQLAFERGVPALLAWLLLLAVYARTLWRLARPRAHEVWSERGLALGALGGAAGFFASGLVHYNLGDSEVAMVFYFVMGLSLALFASRAEQARASETTPAVTE